MSRREAILSVVRRILAGELDLDRLKREEGRRFHLAKMIKNPEILEAIPAGSLSEELRILLLKKPVKTLSGVTPVAVMIQPQGSCAHGCAYCPSANLVAKSYTGFEPAALRAREAGFDPYIQSSGRVRQFEEGGHPSDKCEVIIMGGTFLEMPVDYKRSFVKGVYEGLNGRRSKTLEGAMEENEKADTHKAVGLTIETRPDVCIGHIGEMLSYGATRVELGVQHADDRIYRLINRGHTVKDVVSATKALKDSAFKVLYHIMPGLPGSSKKKDISFVKRLYSQERFHPDMLKIYPTLVLEGTALQKMMDAGSYTPYTSEEAADAISEFYRYIPPYVRVMRIQRDIPAGLIKNGVKKSNLRELVDIRIREKGIRPLEIRSREAGLRGKGADLRAFSLRRMDYPSSGGREVFLSFDDSDGLLAGFLRLRFPEKSPRPEIDSSCALVRELHVYGSEAPLHTGGPVQHHGLGSRLLDEAERIAQENGKGKVVIISGVGVRGYYRKRGYSRDGPYMSKRI
ncbi:MAG: tRNA uridine(34) 5-carboxymethylaminomethyl modification radical SAM/GNAT enzyme Elp3 [Candidatus Micrarchaeota archaeon]